MDKLGQGVRDAAIDNSIQKLLNLQVLLHDSCVLAAYFTYVFACRCLRCIRKQQVICGSISAGRAVPLIKPFLRGRSTVALPDSTLDGHKLQELMLLQNTDTLRICVYGDDGDGRYIARKAPRIGDTSSRGSPSSSRRRRRRRRPGGGDLSTADIGSPGVYIETSLFVSVRACVYNKHTRRLHQGEKRRGGGGAVNGREDVVPAACGVCFCFSVPQRSSSSSSLVHVPCGWKTARVGRGGKN